MPRLLRALAVLVALVIAGGAAAWVVKNPEQVLLDDATRAGAPGRFVRLSDGATHYEVAGPDTGRVVVLVHGFSVPMYIWDSTFMALSAAGYRTVRYDVFGRGWSDRPDGAYDGPMFDRQLDELLDSLHVTGPVDLMGLSYGGFVTGHYTAGHRERVRTLTLVDPVATSSPMPSIITTPLLGTWLWQVTRVPGMADNQASDFLHPQDFPGWADRYRPQMRFKGFGRALLRSAVTASSTNFDSLYAGVARTGVPVLLIWGRQDQTVTFDKSEVVRRAIPSLVFFPVDSAGHLPHLEQTALVNARLFDFLAAHPVQR
ncbi:MAG TPA: alpha/beta hydrolase [Gemmatimonadaceae bacterium]|nr:alpha/beta hydrolase [Gemmatimonadota bacterium]MBK8649377.1 alpha/beta hydrolase [Gemmatimonadota bacterium]MBK9978208.1 alpha/beta hydrolase [Gemmatimonadota bacterium]HNV74000.1 alpha/beta hydrolase [Gemmatimonadaceae bacterium]